MNPKVILVGILALGVTVAAGIVHGRLTYRWGHNAEISELAARLNQFPQTVGNWRQIQDQVPLTESEQELLEPFAVINRYYRHTTGRDVHLFILLGPVGQTAAHTPDICFDARAYDRVGDRRRHDLGDSTVWQSTFRSRDASQNLLSSWYTWTTDGSLNAVERPRFHFAKSRYLVKIQIDSGGATFDSLREVPEIDELLENIQDYLRTNVFAAPSKTL